MAVPRLRGQVARDGIRREPSVGAVGGGGASGGNNGAAERPRPVLFRPSRDLYRIGTRLVRSMAPGDERGGRIGKKGRRFGIIPVEFTLMAGNLRAIFAELIGTFAVVL